MNAWLFKSDAETYPFEKLQKDVETIWDGVRNHQASRYLRSCQIGDPVLFYEAKRNPLAIWGICVITNTQIPDPTQFDPNSPYFDPKSDPIRPRWLTVKIRLIWPIQPPITVQQLKKLPAWTNSPLWRQPRLSVIPVTPEAWKSFLQLIQMPSEMWEKQMTLLGLKKSNENNI